jgi:hypothetical protein
MTLVCLLSRGRCLATGLHATIFLCVLETNKMFIVTFSKQMFFLDQVSLLPEQRNQMAKLLILPHKYIRGLSAK